MRISTSLQAATSSSVHNVRIGIGTSSCSSYAQLPKTFNAISEVLYSLFILTLFCVCVCASVHSRLRGTSTPLL